MSLMQQTLSPVDGSLYVERPYATKDSIEAAQAQAVKAQADWKRVSLANRQAICRRAVEAFASKSEVIAEC